VQPSGILLEGCLFLSVNYSMKKLKKKTKKTKKKKEDINWESHADNFGNSIKRGINKFFSPD